ncbi:MAG: hypothetical protein H0U18_04260 [Pyrinomonadaceae bacterium]|jgi:hypothetical protein|nr:hypothetical protein [Pyrinomonadaceae bacterium]
MPSTHLSLHYHLALVPRIAGVTKYVLNQEEHHRGQTFQDEYLEILKLSAIEYDERYVW